jgi:hypothetical protein
VASYAPAVPRALVIFVALALSIAFVPRAAALIAAIQMCPTSLVPLPTELPRAGALLVTSEPCEDESRRASAIASTFGGSAEALLDEELAPGLHRRAPAGGFLPGMHTIEGLSRAPHGLSILDADATPPAAPSVRSLMRSHHRVRASGLGLRDLDARPWVRSTRITMRLRTPVPEDVVAIAVRWTDWTDSEGGLYGAWTRVTAGEQRFVLICDVVNDCGRSNGHLPRRDERFVARFVDARGLVSEPSSPWVVMGEPP